VAQVVQVVGALFILVAFTAAQFEKLTVESKPYLWMNLAGSTVLAGLALHERQWGFLLLEAVWAAVSAWNLFGARRRAAAPR
jgi:hypothetical protein